MPENGRCPVVHFDHNSDEHSADPVASYRALREKSPDRLLRGVGRLLDPVRLQAAVRGRAGRRPVLLGAQQPWRRGPVGGHPEDRAPVPHPDRDRPARVPEVAQDRQPDHRTGGRRRAWSRSSSTTSRWFIDQIIEDGQADMADVIGVPAIVTVDWLGLDVAEWKRYASAFHATLVAKRGSEEYRQAVEVDFPYLEETHPQGHRGASGAPDGRHHQLPRAVGGRRPAGHRRRGVRHGRPAALRRGRHDRVADQQHSRLAVPAPRGAAAADRRPLADGQGDRGVPAVLLPHAGAGPDGRPTTPSSRAAR